jgi:hypothetical protein
LSLAGLGAATAADAQIGEFPSYHWCPGEDWHPEWGDNWDAGARHDDRHRDGDGDNHNNDFRG